MIILTSNDRNILSIFSIIPKAAEELQQALNLLINSDSFMTEGEEGEISIGTAFFAESLLLLNSLKFSNSSEIATGISNLIKLFERQQAQFLKLSQLKLAGNLIFFELRGIQVVW